MKILLVLTSLASILPVSSAQSGPWQQCGGKGWSGSTTCVSGWTCKYLNDFYSQCQQAASTPTTSNPPSQTTALASLCTQYAYLAANGYELNNNLWGIDTATSGSQCTYYYGPSGSGISYGSAWTWQGDQDTVKSYIYANRVFTRKLVSQISRMPTTVSWSYNTSDIRANVAYDIFTSSDINHVNYSGDYELMIWLNRYGGIWPITATGSPIAQVTLGGHSWDLYFGYNGAMKVYSFVTASGAITSFSADVKEFFNYLTANQGFPASSQYQLIYQFGTEAFTGGPASFTVSQFSAEVS